MSKETDQNIAQGRQPGMALKRAREKAGISLAHVSEKTRVSASRLDALEKTDYAFLGGVAYVTGYTRGYCKVIDVDAAPYIEAFEEDYKVYAAENHPVDSDAGLVVSSKPKMAIWAAAAVGSLLVIAMIWIFSGDEDAPPVPPKPSSAVEGEIKTSLKPTELSVPEYEVDITIQEPVEVNVVETLDTPDDTFVEEEQVAIVEPVSLIDQALGNDNDAVEEASAPSDTDTDRLGLTFADECWLEIRDATGTRIAMLTAQAGQVLSYEGHAPFSVILGNARAAEISLNGSAFNFEPRPGARTIKLAVGSSL